MRKSAISLLLSFLIAILIEFIAWIVTPPNIPQIVLPEDVENLYPSIECYVSGYDRSGSTYISNNNDPQIGFILPNQKVTTVIINFEQPLLQDIPIQIYYAKDGEGLNERNHSDVIAEKGNCNIVIQIPTNHYTHLRIDINGNFSLSTIYMSKEEPTIEYHRDSPKLVRFIGGWIILFIIFELCYAPLLRIHITWKNNRFGRREKEFFSFLSILCVICLLLVLKLNNSSMACYSGLLPNNISEIEPLIVGTPRGVRSDEYLVDTPSFFHNNINGQLKESVFNPNSTSIVVWINNIITLLNPYYWGELYLSDSYAFSWRFIFNSIFLIYVYYRLFVILTEKRTFSIIAALLVLFSPSIQWWSIPNGVAVMCGYVVFFCDFFSAKTRLKKIICAWALVCCTSKIIPVLYPAWDIPLMYLFLAILVGIYITQRKINFTKKDIPYILGTCVLMVCVISAYYISYGDITTGMLETIYPGRRFSTGGDLPTRYWSFYLAAPFSPWKTANIPINQSELSNYLHLFPIPSAIFISRYQEFKANKVMILLAGFNIFSDIYMLFGVGDFIAKYSLLSYTLSVRLYIIWGLSSFLLLLLECHHIIPLNLKRIGRDNCIKCIFLNVSVASFLIWTGINQKALIDYIEIDNFVYVAVGVLLLGNLLFFGKKRIFITLMCILTLVSGVAVNPINFGTDIMTETPLAREIREIDQRDSGKWIALDNWIIPKYVYAQGVDCLNFLSWPPRFDLFEPLDESGEFRNIYNRYAHVIIHLTTEATSFALNYTDSITISLNVNDLDKWDVKYVVAHGEMPARMESIGFDLVYYDTLDNMNIYKVNY